MDYESKDSLEFIARFDPVSKAKFKVDIQMEKDGASAVEFKIDTTGRPYLFHFASPYFFRRLGIQSQSIDIKVHHLIGSALTIEANIFGGLLIEAKHKNNANNGKFGH